MKYLAACCTVKNEASIILEWMAFHRSAGFEHLIIIDNGSNDKTADIIKAFHDQDSVTYINWPEKTPQTEMYQFVLNEHGEKYEWCAFIDADEFLYPVDGTDIRHALCHMGSSSVGVHWHIYGSSGHVTKPEGLVISNYTRRAKDDFFYNRHIKSIVKPRQVEQVLSSHVFRVLGSFIDEDGREFHYNPPYGYFEEYPVVHNKLRINHYHTRSRQEYEAKALRGYFGVDDSKLQDSRERFELMFSSHDQNDVDDRSAEKYLKLMGYYLNP